MTIFVLIAPLPKKLHRPIRQKSTARLRGSDMFEEKIPGEVMQYPYRTANVRDVIVRFPREMLRTLEEELATAAGHRMDNHVVYRIVQHDRTVYVMISDFTVTFANAIEEGPW